MATMADAAGTWQLGDLSVNRLGFGAMRLPADADRAIAILLQAVDLGVNHFDTAAFYRSGSLSANETINRALSSFGTDLTIATKVVPGLDASGNWQSAEKPEQQLRGQVEVNLRELGRERLDLVNLRMRGPGPIAELFGVLAEMQSEGMIRHLGLSNIDASQLAEARAIGLVVCVQNPYALDVRDPGTDEIVRSCGELGIAFVPFFAIVGEHGDPGASRDRSAAEAVNLVVAAIAEAHWATPAQVRLAWTLNLGPHVLAIPGTGNPEHLVENVAAAGLRLTPDEMSRLDRDQ